MEHHHCLNCNETITKNFCANCGQKTDTHRITFKHFILHDILHGIWHIERGILFTLKEVIIRPGQAALDYISGKRIRYYNIFYLCLVTIGLNIVVLHYFGPIAPPKTQSSSEVIEFIGQNLKLILIGFVPLMAFNALLLFRRLKLNIAEHFIIAGMCLLGILLCSLSLLSIKFFGKMAFAKGFLTAILVLFRWTCVLFPIWTYYNATKNNYKMGGFIWRMALFYLMLAVELVLFVAIMILTVTTDGDLIIS